MNNLSHTDADGKLTMVDVGKKEITRRTAAASAKVNLTPAITAAVSDNLVKKGDVLTTAKLAGIMAAKKTADLIPLCHPLQLTHVDLQLKLDVLTNTIEILSEVKTEGKTGVEMEALTAASVAALTIYDMCKGIDKGMVITEIKLLSKSGGKSGDYYGNK